jgi:L-malate glycosyltransferase
LTQHASICLASSSRVHDRLGGTELVTLSYSSWLHDKGIDSVIIGRRSSILRPVIVLTASKTIERRWSGKGYTFPFAVALLPMLLFSLFAVKAILRLHSQNEFSVIHSQDLTYAGLASVIAGRIRGVPVVVQAHAFPLRLRLGTPILDWMLEQILVKFVCDLADKVIVPDDTLRDFLMMNGISSQKITTVELGVDIMKYAFDANTRAKVRQSWGVDDSIVTIGFVGSFRPEKNIEALIRAYGMLLRKPWSVKTRLIIIGSGVLANELTRLASELKIANEVIFLGPRTDVNSLLNGLDIFVAPSLYETFGVALVEAMANGRAIVASDIKSFRSKVVDQQSGLLVDPTSLESIRSALYNLSKDSSLRECLGKNAQIRAKSYRSENAFDHMLGVYRNWLFHNSQVENQ